MKNIITVKDLKESNPKEQHQIDWELYNDKSKLEKRFSLKAQQIALEKNEGKNYVITKRNPPYIDYSDEVNKKHFMQSKIQVITKTNTTKITTEYELHYWLENFH